MNPRKLLLPLNEHGLRTLLKALHDAEDAAQLRYAAMEGRRASGDPRVDDLALQRAAFLIDTLVEADQVLWDAIVSIPAAPGWALTLVADDDTPTTRR